MIGESNEYMKMTEKERSMLRQKLLEVKTILDFLQAKYSINFQYLFTFLELDDKGKQKDYRSYTNIKESELLGRFLDDLSKDYIYLQQKENIDFDNLLKQLFYEGKVLARHTNDDVYLPKDYKIIPLKGEVYVVEDIKYKRLRNGNTKLYISIEGMEHPKRYLGYPIEMFTIYKPNDMSN